MDPQQSLAFDPAAPAPSAAEPPPARWIKLAIENCFGDQKKRWQALPKEEQDAIVAAMWTYAHARERAMAAPLSAAQAPAALGNPAAAPELLSVTRQLLGQLVALNEIPRPSAG